MSRTRVNDFISQHLDDSQVKRSLSKLAQTQKSVKLLGLDSAHLILRRKQEACMRIADALLRSEHTDSDSGILLRSGFEKLAANYVRM